MSEGPLLLLAFQAKIKRETTQEGEDRSIHGWIKLRRSEKTSVRQELFMEEA